MVLESLNGPLETRVLILKRETLFRDGKGIIESHQFSTRSSLFIFAFSTLSTIGLSGKKEPSKNGFATEAAPNQVTFVAHTKSMVR